MTLHILYNPSSGASCRPEDLSFSALFGNCEEDRHDILQIKDYAEFFALIPVDDKIILCGGDGTLNRFINLTKDIPYANELYYYAAGTGNDFARDVANASVDHLIPIKEYISHLPRVTVNGITTYFINNVGFGIDGYCTKVGDRMRKEGKKDINYAGIAVKGLLGKYHPTNASITVDGETHCYKNVWLAPTMKGRYYGGGMMPTPNQNRFDPNGTVSLMVFHCPSKLKTLSVFPSIFKGEHIQHKKMVHIFTGHNIEVCFDRPSPLQIDGETIDGVISYTVRTE